MLHKTMTRSGRCASTVVLLAAVGIAQAGAEPVPGEAGRSRSTFYVAQPDTGARLNIRGSIQFRYHFNERDDDAGDDDQTVGFQMRRQRVYFHGDLNERWSFFTQADFAGGSATVLDLFGTYKIDDGLTLDFGQLRLPLTREELVSHPVQLGGERTHMNSVFTQGRAQGVLLSRTTERWRVAAALSDGGNTTGTPFIAVNEADFAVTARGEYALRGNLSRFREYTSWRGADFAALVGVAGHYQTGGDTNRSADIDLTVLTADVSLEGDGWNAAAAVAGRSIDNGNDQFEDYGFFVQGGAFVSDRVELWGRFDMVLADDDRGGDDFRTISAGLNWYIIPESFAAVVKIQAMWFLDEQDASIVRASTSTALLTSSEDDQFSIFAQIGLLF